MASIIRAKIFFGTAAFSDETMASVDLIGWSIIETSVYIITNCLPHLRPLLSHYTPACIKRALRSSLASFGTYGYGGDRTTTTGKGGSGGHGGHSKLSALGRSKSSTFGQSRSRRSPDGASSRSGAGDDDYEDDTIELTRRRAEPGLNSPSGESPWGDGGSGLEAGARGVDSHAHPHALAPGWERGGAQGKESASKVEIKSMGDSFYRSNSSEGASGSSGLGSITVTREVKLTRT